MKLRRNEKCPCGSGTKYKKCCYLDASKNGEIMRAESQASNWDELAELISKPLEVFSLKVVLVRMGMVEIDEEVSRTFKLKGNHTLYDFHLVLQEAFGWDNDHMFSFYFGGKLFDRENEYSAAPDGEHISPSMGEPNKSAFATQIRDLNLSTDIKFLYLFDYGAELVHEIEIKEIQDITAEDNNLPLLIDKLGLPPPQYEEYE